MDRIDKVLKGIKEHHKKQCEQCNYDGSGCVEKILQEAEEILREVKEKGYEISEGRPAVSMNCREIMRAIRNARGEYIRETGVAPDGIRMTRDVYDTIVQDARVRTVIDAQYIYGMMIEITDQTPRGSLFELYPVVTRSDVNGVFSRDVLARLGMD